MDPMEPDIAREPTLTRQVARLHARIAELEEHGPRSEDDRVLLAELMTAHEELQVADEELRTQQAELDRLLQSQARGRGAQEQFIARLPAPVIATDAHGFIVAANAAAGALLSTRLHRLTRKPLFSFVEPGQRQQLRGRLAQAVAAEESELQTRIGFLLRDNAPVELDVAATLQRAYDVPGGVEVTWVLLGTPAEGAAPDTDVSSLAQTLVNLARIPLDSSDAAAVARQTARLCAEAFPVPVRVSLTLGDPLTPDLVASDSQDAQLVDGAQLMAGEGPCVDAWRTVSRVTSTQLRHDARWPRLDRYLEDVPLVAALAVPLVLGQAVGGVLNVYSETPEVTGEPAAEAAELVSSTVAAVLQEVAMRLELETVAEQLRTALSSRATIDQAKGIVMARHGCDPDEAFRILVKISSNSNVKLRDIAARLVAEAAAGT